MATVTSIFLWASLGIVIPIAIALWNRRRHRRERFGGYYLLREIAESTRRRIQILQLLKLLNRLCLFALIILIFAEPLKTEMRYQEADEGFAVLLDVGRVMQLSDSDGNTLVEEQERFFFDVLDQMPTNVQGSVFFVSEECEAWTREDGSLTGAPSAWREEWERQRLAYSNRTTETQALQECLRRAESIFSERNILKVFISPLPDRLSQEQIKAERLRVEQLSQPQVPEAVEEIEVEQELSVDQLRLQLKSEGPMEFSLVTAEGIETLGTVEESIDLPSREQAALLVQGEEISDPWANQKLFLLDHLSSHEVTLWAQEESPGYLSLLTALRSHPRLEVNRQIGEKPIGEAVIVYGDYPYSAQEIPRAWFFLSPEGNSPYEKRDVKEWVSSGVSSDIRQSFEIQTQDGEIFIRRYAILHPDEFETVETFEDGAPALLKRRGARPHWVSPFDLEDLTTDLTLEPTFIPYLYRRVDSWLGGEDEQRAAVDWDVLWTMPGASKPSQKVLREQEWPGVYMAESEIKVVNPIPAPQAFLKAEEFERMEQEWVEEEVSVREQLLPWLALTAGVELLFGFLAARFGIVVLMVGLGFLFTAGPTAAESNSGIPIGIFSEMEEDRKRALDQLAREASFLSNLDLETSEEVEISEAWRYALIILSSTEAWPELETKQGEKLRQYLERGGLLVFDDPLATTESSFYRSVKKNLEAVFPGREFERIPQDDVIYRTYYLLNEVSGRHLAAPYMMGLKLDERWVAIFSFNDLLGANLRQSNGDYAFAVSPYGETQRMLSQRLLLNLLMYSVTTDYKDDAIHLPHILERRVR